MAPNGNPTRYGLWRYYKAARFESAEDGSSILPSAVIQQILEITGFVSVREFNGELASYAFGEIPRDMQDRLRLLLEPTTDDAWSTFAIDSGDAFPGTEISSPLTVAIDAPPEEITIHGMAFEASKAGYTLGLSASLTAARRLMAKRGEERLCSLLIERGTGSFADLEAADRALFVDWLERAKVRPTDLGTAFDGAALAIERAAECCGIMSKTFLEGTDHQIDYFIECSSGEESGLSFESS